MKKISKVKEGLYLEELKKKAKMPVESKLKDVLLLSN